MIKEACGVVGVYDMDGKDVAEYIYYSLLALQHRGQESAGIAVSDTSNKSHNISSYKDMGLVNQVFNKEIISSLKGNLGIGHVRYSTTGDSVKENAQPLVLNYIKGTLAVAHNGNLVNTEELKLKLQRTGAIFQTTIDSEVIAYYIAKEWLQTFSERVSLNPIYFLLCILVLLIVIVIVVVANCYKIANSNPVDYLKTE